MLLRVRVLKSMFNCQMDMQNGVHGRFLDHSTSVREAAIELVGKFILIRPELTAQYYDMLSERILVGAVATQRFLFCSLSSLS